MIDGRRFRLVREMIKITERPVFEFEKREYLQKLRPVRGVVSSVGHYIGTYVLLPMAIGGLVSMILRAAFRLPEDAAEMVGLVVALIGAVYLPLKIRRYNQAFYEQEQARLETSVIETLDIEVRRAWLLDECSCCSMSYLLEVSDAEVVFLETMDRADSELDGFPARRMKIERERETKTIWDIRNEGPPVFVEGLDFMVEDLFPEDTVECEVLKFDELPEALRARLAAA